jgi:ribosomal protein S12 methylthiotransferase
VAAAPPNGAPRRSAFLKIADGCNAPCSFCTIPKIKGGYGSKAPDLVVAEARALAAQGVREVVLIAQDTTAYGYDWGEKEAFAALLQRLADEVPEVAWWRVMYAYPGHLTERAVQVMAANPAVCHYLDMPLQHAHPDTLRRMRRPSLEIARRNIDRLRAAMPDIALRTTFIVGFPGETEEEFAFLLDFLREVGFDRVGVFKYSRELGTPSGHLPDQVPDEIKEERYHRAMALQHQVSLRRNRRQVGRRLSVLLEGAAEAEGRRGRPLLAGRSYRDAPEVDGLVFCRGRGRAGDLVTVQVTDALPYDLSGRIVRG